MNTARLLSVVLVSVALLVVHSYFNRGFKLTFNFFLFAFIAAMRKEIGSFFGSGALASRGSPFFFPETGTPFAISFLTVIFGWVLTFYIAWALAEKITKKLGYFNNKIFPTLLFAGIIAASISYAVEAVGVDIGWWRWKFYDGRFSNFLIGHTHFVAIEAWFYFAIHFLAVYFLIECSKFKKFDWKCLFFLIYFMRTWSIVFSEGSHLPRIMEQRVMFCLLIISAFLVPLKFELPVFKSPRISVISRKLIDSIPFLVLFNLVGVLLFLSIAKIKDAHLIISSLPLVILILLAIERIKFVIIIFFCLFLLLYGGRLMVPVIIPVIIFMIFKLFGKTKLCLRSS